MLSSLQQEIEDTRARQDAFQLLYGLAKSLRDEGCTQAELYEIFIEAYRRHRDDKDETFYDILADALDCIWSGGYGKGLDLFPRVLNDAQLRKP